MAVKKVKKPVAKKVTKKPVKKAPVKAKAKRECIQTILDCDTAIAFNQYKRAQEVSKLNALDPKSIVVNL